MSDEPNDPFRLCQTAGEVYLAVFHLLGAPGLDDLLTKLAPNNTREELRCDARQFERVGLKPLADLLRAHALKAMRAPKRAPPTFVKRWPR